MHLHTNSQKISVIMPTFNHGSFIKNAITSVLNQTYPNIELIIIDNYSSDNTQEIINHFKDNRIKYLKFKNNGIIAASRNHGIRNTAGKYIAFIDSDDTWELNKLTEQIMCMHSDPEIGLCFGLFKVHSTNTLLDGKINGPKNTNANGYIYKKLIRGNFIPSSSVLTKKNILENLNGFDESKKLIGVEDYDLWLRITKNSKAAYIPKILGTYTDHNQNLSKKINTFDRRKLIIDKHCHSGHISPFKAKLIKAKISIHKMLCDMQILP